METSFSHSNQSGKRRVGFAFLFAAFLGSCATTDLRAQVVVVPNSLATNDGNGFGTSPAGSASARWLHIHDASQFGALSGPSFLTKFAYRPDRVLGESGPRSLNLRIYASTTSRGVAGISTIFAENLGTNNTLVFDGTVTVAAGNLPGPGNTRQFDYVFPFTTPFLYDPADGNLVLDLQIESSGSALTFDTVSGDRAIGRVGIGSSSAATGGIQASHVTELTFEPPPLVTPTFSDANWSGMGGLAGVDGRIVSAVVDGSGNLFGGGMFTVAGDVLANNVAKWDGSNWTALDSGIGGASNARVSALAVSGDDLYVGGLFTTAGGAAASNIAKWDGSKWTAVGSGISGDSDAIVSALAVSGGNLYAAGYFTTAGGIPVKSIAKWDGSSWTALGLGIEGSVSALAVSGNDLYAAGYFTMAGGIAAKYVAKWDGSKWTALGSGVDYFVHALAVSGSNLYAAGEFTTAGGIPVNSIAKWDGSNWTALGSGIDDDNGYRRVEALAVSGSDLYVGGEFMTLGGNSARHIAKWDGSSWTEVGSGLDALVHALAVSGTNLYVTFDSWTSESPKTIARWNGSNWSALGSGMTGHVVFTLAVSGSNLYAGGSFSMFGGSAPKYLAKWDGTSWSAMGLGIDGSSQAIVSALAVSGSDVYAGGSFTTGGGTAATNIAKWDGTSWTALGSGIDGSVSALAVSGSDLYAAGNFTLAGGIAAKNIAKWDGNVWSALGSGLSNIQRSDIRVFALAVSGSDLYVGGRFATAGGIPVSGMAKWDGSTWSALGSGLGNIPGGSSEVYALAISGSDLYAGGRFSDATNIVAKWNGNSWTALGSGMGYVNALAILGGDLYAGGDFTTAGGVPASQIARWDGSAWKPLGSGLDRDRSGYIGVKALAVSGSDLYVAGGFSTAGGKVSAYVARAYLRALPTLSIIHSSEQVTVSWPTVDTADFVLEQAGLLAAPAGWVTNLAPITDDGTTGSVTLPATNSPRFFRLGRR